MDNSRPEDQKEIRILLVDDDEDERGHLVDAIKQLKLVHIIYSAVSCEGMVEFLEANPLPHMILMDVNMPAVNGHQCLKKLKAMERYSAIPVLMYSVSAALKDIEDAYASGAHYYIVKPHAYVNLPVTLKRVFQLDWRMPPPVTDRNNFVINISYND